MSQVLDLLKHFNRFMSKNLKIALFSILGVLLLGLVAGGSYYLGQNKTKNQENQTTNTSQSNNQEAATATNQTGQISEAQTNPKPTTPTVKPMFNGKIQKINQDLGLLITDNIDSNGQAVLDAKGSLTQKSYPATYYQAGKFLDGKYKDQTRVLGYRENEVGGSSEEYFFATLDFKTFTLLNYSQYDSVSDTTLNTIDKLNLGEILNKQKVASVDYIDFEMPKTIKLDSQYSLYLKNTYTDSTDLIDSSKLKPLTFKDFPYPVFAQIYETHKDSKDLLGSDKIFDGYSSVAIPDSSGLVYKYSLVWNVYLNEAVQNQAKFDQEIKSYQNFYNKRNIRSIELGLDKKYDEKLSTQLSNEFPNPPLYPDQPSHDLSLKSDKINLNSGEQSFKSYSGAFPGGCGIAGDLNTVSGISDNDLVSIGKIDNTTIFKLKDSNNPLYKEQYNAKVNLGESTIYTPSTTESLSGGVGKETKEDIFSSVNPNMKKPTFEEYVAKNPLLLFKDSFNRLTIAGEYDYLLQGGCGKPVVYLYPSVPTKVNVKFLANIQFTTDIPKYVENLGWNVYAKPNGELTDLQTQYTNCDIFNNPHTGSEYAKEACEQNNYPYLYWSGNRIGAEYPRIDKGWIVEKKDLSIFLNSKLDEVGLTPKEKSDMLEYWIPYLNNKSGNYFRISFLQTKEINNLAPMQITPKPDKVFRIFLDWDNYTSKPNFEIQPQILDKLSNRSGFTVVEWGGLKK